VTNAARECWALLARLARPYRWRFASVAVLALLATGTDLLSPIIYREAINDIAGLYVGMPGETAIDLLKDEEAVSGPEASPPESGADGTSPAPVEHDVDQGAADGAVPVDESPDHHAGHVAPRTMEQTLRTLLWGAALLFAINVLSHLFSLLSDQQTVWLSSRIEADLIQRTFGRVLRLPLAFFSRRASGTLAKQIDQSDQAAPLVSAAAHDVVPELLRMLGVLAIMFTQSWRLTLVALALLPPYLWLVWRSSRRLETGLTQYYEMWDAVSARIQDALGAVKTVKLSGAEQRESLGLRNASDEAYDIYVDRNRLANFYVFWQSSINYLTQALVLGYGGWLVFDRQLTPGDVVMFVVYLDKLYTPIETLTALTLQLQEHLASIARAVRLLSESPEPEGGLPVPPGPGAVVFESLRFGYLPGRRVLDGVSFSLPAGGITALVGPSGAGKTTASDLLLRLFEPESGRILVDGVDIRSLDAAALRREIAVVAADGAIFQASIADNLRYMRPEASDAEVLSAAQDAGLSNLLERLPDGLATWVGEHGVGLSVGERQRVQIARALVARPRVLILDEATANLDYATENDIRSVLLDRPGRPTTLVIAHRYSMVAAADHVVLLGRGKVQDQGSVAELVARNAWFAAFAAGRTGRARKE
jgi:ABC-type multidrug transport system fused ATPase/permease subunit